MSKFVNMLSASDSAIKETRAKQLAEDTVLEVDSFINNLKRELSKLNNKLTSLTDLAPDNTYSLRPGSKDFDASRWVNELHETKMEIKLKTIELEVASEIRNEWFTSEDEK
ncbi:MAG: hypothetical protein ABFD07_09960 [Methanobacterium sp.]